MTSARAARRFQFTLRRLMVTLTWGSLLFAICVGQQQAATRQRAHLERLKAMGILPRWAPVSVQSRAHASPASVAPDNSTPTSPTPRGVTPASTPR